MKYAKEADELLEDFRDRLHEAADNNGMVVEEVRVG